MSERSSLHDVAARAGAVFVEEAGWLVPTHFGDPPAEYRQARESAGLFDLSHRGKVEVTGSDAKSFLHNLCTNDIAALSIGSGREAFLATAKAKVVAHVLIDHVQTADGQGAFWIDAASGLAEKVVAHLNRYLISEQVEIADRSREQAHLHLAGLQARSILERALASAAMELAELQHREVVFPDGGTCRVRRRDDLALPGYDLIVASGQAGLVWQALTKAGARPAGQEAYHILRVEAGTPLDGADIDENTLVMEVGRTERAVCYTKGCYLGQEPIVRARDLGHVNRSFRGLKVKGDALVARGSRLLREGKEVGRITSAALSPRLGTIALAFVRRGSDEPGTRLELEGGRVAEVKSLPLSG